MAGNPRDYLGTGHPKTALLVIEVSDTTLPFDRNRKASLYAAAGIADYWIINLMDRQLEVLRQPIADASAPHGLTYGQTQILKSGEAIAPLAAPTSQIAVTDLLP